MRILIVAAHPDDEALGCGGTIARLAKTENVDVLILGEGITSRYVNTDKSASSEEVAALKQNCRKAADVLGVKEVFIYDYPDNRFDTVPMLEIVKTIESIIAVTKPDTVFTHHISDLNIDHAITSRATITATRPICGHVVERLLAYEIPSSTEWSFNQLATGFKPNVFIDITETLSQKTDAMKIYESESREFPHPRSPEALISLAKLRGATAGLNAAEAFELIREISREVCE